MAAITAGACRLFEQAYQQKIAPRATHLSYLPRNIVDLAAGAAIAVVSAVNGLLTAGRSEQAPHFMHQSSLILNFKAKQLYANTIGTLNPQAISKQNNSAPQDDKSFAPGLTPKVFICPNLQYLATLQQDFMDDLTNTKSSSFSYHVKARFAAPILAIAMVIAAIANGCLGAVAAVASIACLGSIPFLNKCAFDNFPQFGLIFNQIYHGAVGVLHPAVFRKPVRIL